MSLPRNLRRFAAITTSAIVTLGFVAACGSSEANTSGGDGDASDEVTTLKYQGTPASVAFPELAEDLGYFDVIELEYVSDTTSGPTSIQNAATGETDFGAAFNGAIVKLAAAGAPITAVVSSYGADEETYTGYYTLEGSGITSARDLIGKSVGMNTLGAHHEFIVREWLAQQGLSNDEISQVELTVVPPVNSEQALREGQIDVAALGGIFRDSALERGEITELFTDSGLYGDFAYGTYVLRDEFIEANPTATEDFTQGVARAIRWAQVTPREEVIERYKRILTERGRNEDPDLADFWKSPSIPAPGGVIDEREISVWIDWLVRNEELEDDAVEAEELFTNEFNPYYNGTFDPEAGPDGE